MTPTQTKQLPSFRLPQNTFDRLMKRAAAEKRKGANMLAVLADQSLDLDLSSELFARLQQKAEEKKTTVSKLVAFYLNKGLSET